MRILIATMFEIKNGLFELITLDYIKRTFLFKSEIKSVKLNKILNNTDKYYLILLDQAGAEMSSLQFANKLNFLFSNTRKIMFLIGDANGYDSNRNIYNKANEIWTLSKMTFPHKMALCFLAEQIYRAGEIIRCGPYHR